MEGFKLIIVIQYYIYIYIYLYKYTLCIIMGIASTHFQYHGYFPSGNEDDDYRATPLKCHLEDGSS